MALQLATVDVTLNAFYGYPMLSPTTRFLQNSKTEVISGDDTHPKTCIFIILTLAPPFIYRSKLFHLDRTTSTKAEARPTWVSQDLRLGRIPWSYHLVSRRAISYHVPFRIMSYHFISCRTISHNFHHFVPCKRENKTLIIHKNTVEHPNALHLGKLFKNL